MLMFLKESSFSLISLPHKDSLQNHQIMCMRLNSIQVCGCSYEYFPIRMVEAIGYGRDSISTRKSYLYLKTGIEGNYLTHADKVSLNSHLWAAVSVLWNLSSSRNLVFSVRLASSLLLLWKLTPTDWMSIELWTHGCGVTVSFIRDHFWPSDFVSIG